MRPVFSTTFWEAFMYPRVAVAGVFFLLAGGTLTGVKAQNRFPPDTLKNLKVLPASTTPRELVNIMRGFATSLGVRCQFCHVGEEGRPLQTFDFVSDDKRTKQTARLMMQMVQSINQQTLARIPDRPAPGVDVTCITCHRGVSRPVPLGQIVVEAATAGGADSARKAYQQLRTRYYGRAAYDFGEGTLIGAAMDLRGAGKFDDAIAVLRLNDEQFPTSAATMTTMGELLLARQDTAGAIQAFRAALKRDSTETGARARLRALGQQP